MKRLVIGSNSALVRGLGNFDVPSISHCDIPEVDFSNYDEIFLFSWSKRSLHENVELIEAIPGEKLIFVSTIAVFSIGLKQQWNNYPNWKAACETLTKSRGARS